LCVFGKVDHSCKQFKLSDISQAQLVKQVVETRLLSSERSFYFVSCQLYSLLANSTDNNLLRRDETVQKFEDTVAALRTEIEHYKHVRLLIIFVCILKMDKQIDRLSLRLVVVLCGREKRNLTAMQLFSHIRLLDLLHYNSRRINFCLFFIGA